VGSKVYGQVMSATHQIADAAQRSASTALGELSHLD
jgi:hypothetical protein